MPRPAAALVRLDMCLAIPTIMILIFNCMFIFIKAKTEGATR